MTLQDPDSTAELVRGARAGDPAAWARLVDRFRAPLLDQVERQIPPGAAKTVDPEDVLQSSLLQAWRGLKNFDYADKGSLDRWLATIVNNNMRAKLRRMARRGREEVLDTGRLREESSRAESTPEQAVAAAEDHAFAERRLAALAPEDRELVLLHLQENLTFTEIAARRGIDRRTVSERYWAIMRRLSKEDVA